jgi:hypothetical protein
MKKFLYFLAQTLGTIALLLFATWYMWLAMYVEHSRLNH